MQHDVTSISVVIPGLWQVTCMHMLQSPAGAVTRSCCGAEATYNRASCKHLSRQCCKSSTAESDGSGRCRNGTTVRRHCTCNAERLNQSSLLKRQTARQLEAEVCRVVHKLAQGAMHRWQREKFDVGIQVVPALPASSAHTTLGIMVLMTYITVVVCSCRLHCVGYLQDVSSCL